MTKEDVFPKGSYVVLLSSCTGTNNWIKSMPENYCYKLKRDCNWLCFYPEIDINNSDRNGWCAGLGDDNPSRISYGNLDVRLATLEEIYEYERLGKPFPVNKEEIKYDYSYLIPILKKFKIK